MATRELTMAEIEAVCETLSYVPTRNVRGLGNGSASILYDQWAPNSVCVHSHIPEPRYLTRGFLSNMFRYPFSNVDWIVGVTPGDNEKALAFNKRIGFTEAYRLPEGFSASRWQDGRLIARGVDHVFQIMHHSTCRYWRRPCPTCNGIGDHWHECAACGDTGKHITEFWEA